MAAPEGCGESGRQSEPRTASGTGGAPIGTPGGEPIVILSNCPWDSQWRRRQQVAARLASRRTVYYLDPPFPALDFARGRVSLASWLAGPLQTAVDPSGVRVVRGAVGVPAERFCGAIRRLNGRLQRDWARTCLAALRRRGELESPILICYEPLLHPLAGLGPARAHIYDAADDYAAYARPRHLRRVLRARMEGLAAACDLTVAANVHLGDRLRPAARRLEVLPHGVDAELFRPDAQRGTRFDRTPGEGAPRAVYHGTLNHLIDVELLAALLRGGIELSLAGECAWSPRVLARLQTLGIVRHHGLLPQREVAALVAAADVGILPYRAAPGVNCAEPLKRLEFLAAGLPVVATDFSAPYPSAAGLVVTRSPEEFVAAVRSQREQTPDERVRLRELALRQTWDAQVATLAGWLDGLERGRR